MPFKSQAQRRFMYSQHPGIAKRWEKETPKGKLPDKKEAVEMDEAKKKGKKDDKRQPGGEHIPDLECVPWHMSGLNADVDGIDEAVDMKQLRDPQGFIAGVEKFVADTKKDVDTIQHFAQTYGQSTKMGDEQKAAYKKAEFPLKMLGKFADELARQVKGTGGAGASSPSAQPQQAQKPGLMSKLFGRRGA